MMWYRYEIINKYGVVRTSTGTYTRDEVLTYIRHVLAEKAVNFGDGFWSKSGVYLGRIVAVDAKSDYTESK